MLVDPLKALIGGEVDVPTPYGMKTIKLPSGTPDGEQIRLENSGIKGIKSKLFGKANGDLIAIIKYTKPQKYSKEELKTLNKIFDDNNNNDQVNRYYEQAKKEMK